MTQRRKQPPGRRITLDDIPEPTVTRRPGMRSHLREQAKPHYAMAGFTMVGGVVHAISTATGQPATVAMAVALIVVAVTLTVWRFRRRWRIALAAAAWLVWVAASGLDWTTFAAMTTTGCLLALGHLRDHRIPIPPEAKPEPEPVDTLSYPMLWARNNADGGALPETYLSNGQEIKTGLRYDLYLRPGRQSLGKAQNALAELRTGLRLLPTQDLILEQHPRLDESVISLTIVRQSKVLTAAQPWTGGTYDREAGTIAIGPYVDGEGVAVWLMHGDNRLFGGFFVGSTGSGKSRQLESLALGLVDAGAVVWFGDPQHGASSPFLARRADWFARDTKGIYSMLCAAHGVKRLRQMENNLNDWEGWTPEQGRRPLIIIIDECHSALAVAEIQALVAELAREGGKVGIALILASQVATLDAFGGSGHSEAVRSSVVAGNLVLMRTKSRNTKGVLPGVNIDPSAFPRVPGYGYLVDDTGKRRSAPCRGYYLDDEGRDAAADALAWPDLDPSSAGAAGRRYASRRQQEATDRAALAETIALLASGQDLDEDVVAPFTSPPRPAPVGSASGPLQVVHFPRWSEYAAAFNAPAASSSSASTTSSTDSGRRTAVDVVFDLVSQGVSGPKELRERSGYSAKAVENALNALKDAGRVSNPRHGVWEPAREVAGQGAAR